MADNPDDKLSVVFKTHSTKNEAESKKAGRPIFVDMEVCEIRTPGDRNSVKVFPAVAVCRWIVDDDGGQVEQTYAERFNKQYLRFKESHTQVQEGTPLSELPFLTEGKRLELRALHIHTAEQLASLDGNPLKSLGIGGREFKDKAQAYIDAAAGTADVTSLAEDNAKLRADIEQLRAQIDGQSTENTGGLTDEQMKVRIADLTGSRPRGNPSTETLMRTLSELEAETPQTEAA